MRGECGEGVRQLGGAERGLVRPRRRGKVEQDADARGRGAGVVHRAVLDVGGDDEEASSGQGSRLPPPELVRQRAAQHVLELRRLMPVPRDAVRRVVPEDRQLCDEREPEVSARNFHDASIACMR